ncbi:MAG: type II toxin-antitoxin system VapC family toxin [Planctomycetaceae bacterium]
MRVLVDSNVLLRMVKADDPQHAIAEQALAWFRNQGHELVIVPQCAYEFYVVATRPIDHNGLGLEPIAALSDIEELQLLLLMIEDEEGVLENWKELVARHTVRGKTAHDARLAAAMRRHGMTHVLTFNGSDFERYMPEVIPVSPATVLMDEFAL